MAPLSTDVMIGVMCDYFPGLDQSQFNVTLKEYEDLSQTIAVLPYTAVKPFITEKDEYFYANEIRVHGFWEGKDIGPQYDRESTSIKAIVQLTDDDNQTVNYILPTTKVDMLAKLKDFLPKAPPTAPVASSIPMTKDAVKEALKRIEEYIDKMP